MQRWTREDVMAAIHERVAVDPVFRDWLVSDPGAALAEVMGMPVPESVRVTVHQETPADIHLVIPASADLSDEDLSLVAGGFSWTNPTSGPVTCGCA